MSEKRPTPEAMALALVLIDQIFGGFSLGVETEQVEEVALRLDDFAAQAVAERKVTIDGTWQRAEDYPPYTGDWWAQMPHPVLVVRYGRCNAKGKWEFGFGGHPPDVVIGWQPAQPEDESP